MKFCKDKDEASKKELEEQKKKLIDLKLKQSIERIEKNKQPTAAPAEDADAAAERDNMLALKQALTGGCCLTRSLFQQQSLQPTTIKTRPRTAPTTTR